MLENGSYTTIAEFAAADAFKPYRATIRSRISRAGE